MSAIALLPDDLLGDIFLLVDDKSTEQKFDLAQVSQRWRSLALSSPLLWSSFRVATKKDGFHLPTLLKRSGISSMLDVELCVVPQYEAAPTHPCATALVPYAPRLRTIIARTSLPEQILAPLLDGQLDFPALDTLRVHGSPLQVQLGIASAPSLRILDLSLIFPEVLETLLSPGLEEIRLILAGPLQRADMLHIFSSCPRLRRLIFHTSDYDVADEEPMGLIASYMPLHSPNLNALDIQLALADIIYILGRFQDVVLPEVSTCIYNGHDEEDMVTLCSALLRGLDALVSFEVQDDQCIILRDAAERVRTMRVWNDDSCWEITDVWCHLSAQYSLNASVKHIQISTTYWDELVDALAEYPVRTARAVTVRVLTDWEPVHLLREGSMRDLRDVAVPGLDCVELACRDRTSLPPQVVGHILRRFLLDDARTIKVVVFVDGAIPTSTPMDVWKESMAAYMEQEGQGRWSLTFK
ncbi:hypothetical protein AURDEDRAFT_152295 [Auricularia subglabra TFB-10046 SS5]|nr:hypothetical protein AURDEDRAFT_152295 [Auricularia subglabra TFB-10046 SS5]